MGEPSQLYLAGYGTFLLTLLFGLLSAIDPKALNPIAIALLVSTIVFIVLGFSVDTYRMALRLWESKVGRLALGVIITAIIKLSYLLSKHELNDLTGLPTSYIGDSISIFTALSVPLVTLAVSAISLMFFLLLYIPVFMAGVLYEILNLKKLETNLAYQYIFRQKKTVNHKILLAGRFAGAYASLPLIGILIFYYSQLSVSTSDYKKELIVYIDYFREGYCTNIDEDERYLPLKGDFMSVARRSDEGWTFSIKKCSHLVE
jgi:hypothetical protein